MAINKGHDLAKEISEVALHIGKNQNLNPLAIMSMLDRIAREMNMFADVFDATCELVGKGK